MLDAIRGAIVSLEQRIDRRFEAVDARFAAIDARFASIDLRLDAIDRRFEGVDRRLDGLDTKMSRQFMWLVGLHVTTLLAIVAALLAR